MPLLSFYLPHSRVTAPHSDELITKQSMKDECDIHNILRQYQKTGIIQHINQQQPIFDDLPDITDFQTSLSILDQAEQAFAALPSSIRDSFQNDPAELLRAIQDPGQRERLTELGILRAPAAPRPPDPGAPSSSPSSSTPSSERL